MTRECVTHFHACDCREAKFAATEKKLDEAREGWHMANGVADLAMKHRDAAESELAALRQRIASAPSVVIEFSITGGWWINVDKRGHVPQALHGKRVRLVVEDATP